MRISRVFWGVFLLALLAPISNSAFAQTTAGPQAVITWRVIGGSAPSSYAGKVLPSANSAISASVAVLNNGKFVPLNNQTVYWYLDDNFIGGGTGEQIIAFGAPGNNETMSLRVEVPNYGNGLMDTAYIPMVDPQVVIVAPYPNNTFTGSSVSLQAVPYFFSTTDLSQLAFSWDVNGQAVAAAENPQTLNINLSSSTPAGYSLAVDLEVKDSTDPYLSVSNNVTLTSPSQ